MDEYIFLYHGTKFKKNADKILKEGFNAGCFFSYDLNDAYSYGGKYVFMVVFIKTELPKHWQVRCLNKIPPNRISSIIRYSHSVIFQNKKIKNAVFSNSLEFPDENKPYAFEEKKPDFFSH